MLTQLDVREWSTQRSVAIWRLDLTTHSAIGNKCYKLRGNLKRLAGQRVLTFGGAFSNHLYAFAALARQYRVRAIGVIRGDAGQRNEVLSALEQCGMQLHFVSRADYRRRHEPAFQRELTEQLGADALLPEGGSNLCAVEACRQIATQINSSCEGRPAIAVSVGTGATYAGIAAAALRNQQVIGLAVVNDPQTAARVAAWHAQTGVAGRAVLLAASGRYAKPDDEVLRFILRVFETHQIALDPVYNGPALHRLLRDEIGRDSELVFVHTGGLSGACGMRARFDRLGQSRLVEAYFSRIAVQLKTDVRQFSTHR